jgi:hypothetical protein
MVLLGEPRMYRHGLGTRTERLIMSHMVDMTNMMMFAFETMSFHVMIGCGIVNLVRVSLKKTKRDVVYKREFT